MLPPSPLDSLGAIYVYMIANCTISITSRNVRGLGDSDKCAVGLDTLLLANPSISCLQETKLNLIVPPKSHLFSPSHLSAMEFIEADGIKGTPISSPKIDTLLASTLSR